MSAFVPFPAKRVLPVIQSKKSKSTYVVYRGPSALNGAEIVAILTGVVEPSDNAKTGPMAQLWIMPANEAPHLAQKSGADEAVCGNCPMRPIHAKGKGMTAHCYVTTFQGPRSTWQANRDKTVDALADAVDAIRGKTLRLGAYGDPAAIPESAGVVQALVAAAQSWTGYTHQWREEHAQWLRPFCMASVDLGEDGEVIDALHAAHSAGWRTFRVTDAKRPTLLQQLEVVCPNTTHGIKCADCGLCEGNLSPRTKSVVIAAH